MSQSSVDCQRTTPKNQFLRQRAIDRRQPSARLLHGLLEEILDPAVACGAALQDPRGKMSWFFNAHLRIMTIVQLQSSFYRNL